MIFISRILLFLILFVPASWTVTTRKNAAIKAASKDYANAKYEASVASHLLLGTEFGINSPNSSYNLALSYHYNEQLEEAQAAYLGLIGSANPMIASFASNQNGILLGKQEKYKEALEAFKFALIKDPLNEPARYNYELLSRWLEENEDQNQEDQDKEDEEQKDKEDQEQEKQDQDKDKENKKDGEGDEKTEEDEASESEKKDDKSGEKSQEEKDSQEPSDMESDLSEREKSKEQMKERLKEMNLSPEQASQILDAMNAAELRYIQQNKKKPTKRPEKGLPDW
ncbi:hypothetical protein P872_19845 [Rhodonellum psychrophilum GCM71 = DSM 17998]|uniref:BatC protein n=2 Tax=Rhodonellum TaxID=336827 RepID=U5BM88_9BACT|nr:MULTISPECIES: hypothetical protein [Rhodonellum]ERM81610.1 hypothetical protein P872_19845 [Rhodonellum psychrophilum GCM71 = DSM 17998]SDZ33592.1 hypothetical protein SAMN05444412_110153 [Rhodonellum ikkaensis]